MWSVHWCQAPREHFVYVGAVRVATSPNQSPAKTNPCMPFVGVKLRHASFSLAKQPYKSSEGLRRLWWEFVQDPWKCSEKGPVWDNNNTWSIILVHLLIRCSPVPCTVFSPPTTWLVLVRSVCVLQRNAILSRRLVSCSYSSILYQCLQYCFYKVSSSVKHLRSAVYHIWLLVFGLFDNSSSASGMVSRIWTLVDAVSRSMKLLQPAVVELPTVCTA